jgi:hypothetical protein
LHRKVELSWTTISETLEWKWAAVLYMVEVFYFTVVRDWFNFSPPSPGEGSSGSEDENSEDDSDSRDHAYRCQHFFATSKLLALWNFLSIDSRGT